LPTTGALYLNGTAVTSLPGGSLTLAPAQATQLHYDPAGANTQGTATPAP